SADSRRPPRGRDGVGPRAGDLVPRLPSAGAAHGADPSPLRSGRLVGVHGNRALLVVRRHLRRTCDRHLLRRLPPHSRERSRVTRADVIGLAETGSAVTRRLRAEGVDVTILEDAPAGGTRHRERADEARASGAALVEQPSDRATRDAVAGSDLVVPSPLVRVDHPALAEARVSSVPVRSEIDLAAERTSVPIVAVTGTNGKTTVTTLTA